MIRHVRFAQLGEIKVRVQTAAREFHSYAIKLGSAFTLISMYIRAIALVDERFGNIFERTIHIGTD